MALVGLSIGEVQAVLPPEHVEAEKASAAYQITIHLEAVDLVERSTTGGLDVGRARGRVLDVVRAPHGSPTPTLRRNDIVGFRVPAWSHTERDQQPPGPERLYWGPDAPQQNVSVWGSFDGEEFVAVAVETRGPGAARPPAESVGTALDRIDQIAAAFRAPGDGDFGAELERITGLRIRRSGPEADELVADGPAADGWAVDARFRVAGNSRILILSVNDSVCLRPEDVTARHGSGAQPIPIPGSRHLPAPWHLRYVHPWGSIAFGFRMAQPNDYDGCLVELILRQDT